MSELNSERVITPMPKSLVDKIDDYRFKERIPSRAEAIRRLVEKGLSEPWSDGTRPCGRVPGSADFETE